MPTARPIEGGCRCGRVRLRIDAAPMITMPCHFRACQRVAASALSSSVAVPSAAPVVTGTAVIGGLHRHQVRHPRCDHCHGWLFTRIDRDRGFANVRGSVFDRPGLFASFIDTSTDETVPRVATPAQHRFPGFPPTEASGPLLAEYAAMQMA